jgi:hypothetical protein
MWLRWPVKTLKPIFGNVGCLILTHREFFGLSRSRRCNRRGAFPSKRALLSVELRTNRRVLYVHALNMS